MFDIHSSLKELNKQPFFFKPNRYEFWIDGNLTNSGKAMYEILGEVKIVDGEEKLLIIFDGTELYHELCNSNVFDKFITSHDRLQLVKIPIKTNVECVGLSMMQRIVGFTCQEKYFSRSEPYCCNLFTINGLISKVTFSFSNPEKLLEFYSEPTESNTGLNFIFESPDHIRYENGKHISGPHGGAKRVIKCCPNITGGEGYSVTITDEFGNIQMATKQMQITSVESSKVILVGFGSDANGNSFKDYGLIIHHREGEMTKCTLQLLERNVTIDYLI
jgi:hypothetical protein